MDNEMNGSGASQYINLAYLRKQTKGNQELIKSMIELYLEQTPGLITTMRNSSRNQDWKAMQGAIHKMIPSFWMMGFNPIFEAMAKTIQQHAGNSEQPELICKLFLQIEEACLGACKELREEIAKLN